MFGRRIFIDPPASGVAHRNHVYVFLSLRGSSQRTFGRRPSTPVFVNEQLIFSGQRVRAELVDSREVRFVPIEVVETRGTDVAGLVGVRRRVLDGGFPDQGDWKDGDPVRPEDSANLGNGL